MLRFRRPFDLNKFFIFRFLRLFASCMKFVRACCTACAHRVYSWAILTNGESRCQKALVQALVRRAHSWLTVAPRICHTFFWLPDFVGVAKCFASYKLQTLNQKCAKIVWKSHMVEFADVRFAGFPMFFSVRWTGSEIWWKTNKLKARLVRKKNRAASLFQWVKLAIYVEFRLWNPESFCLLVWPTVKRRTSLPTDCLWFTFLAGIVLWFTVCEAHSLLG